MGTDRARGGGVCGAATVGGALAGGDRIAPSRHNRRRWRRDGPRESSATHSYVRSRAHNGMAASDPHRRLDSPSEMGREVVGGQIDCLSARALEDRLEEEISRAGRHGTPLSCLLVAIEDLGELALRSTDASCPSRRSPTSARRCCASCAASTASGGRATRELLVLLPGADGPRGEIVARRVLDRLRAIKIEAGGLRRPLRVSVGLAAWREDLSGDAAAGADTRRGAARTRGARDAGPVASPWNSARRWLDRRIAPEPRRSATVDPAGCSRDGPMVHNPARMLSRIRAVAAAPDGRSRPRAARRQLAADGDRGARRAARRGRQRREQTAAADRAGAGQRPWRALSGGRAGGARSSRAARTPRCCTNWGSRRGRCSSSR